MTPVAAGASNVVGAGAGRELRRYVAVVFAVVAVLGALLGLVFRGPGDAAAITVSAVVALVVQPLASVLGRSVAGGGSNITARMGLGALVRLFTLIAYAVVMAAAVRLPITAALVSLAAFYFATSVIEPLLIKP